MNRERIAVKVNGRHILVPPGSLVAVAVALGTAGQGAHVSPGGDRRQPFCGMGVCGECRVQVDGQAHRLGCQTVCVAGMEILTDD